ncbi:hypothetical protein [Couchioplanes caeruleus]|uniref:Uncharacterized protein n=1 Tax=Couchioplanes caeruleus subsp. caeruleus TaxID=56427 RepID=A0A1K0GZK3_9ACTN|nr:hypothetical protein [Couchioplanes caeruleus]OJF14859.1 hypothetical protein BG844_07500 [Couchioplanes caeruleus subsp. caeruleus]
MLSTAAVMAGGTACGASGPESAAEGGAPKVATLASGGSTPAASGKPAADTRPRERLDTTPEEFEAMLAPYNKCMQEQGAGIKAGASARKPPSTADLTKWEKADRICKPKFFPLPPWEKDPANPESKDFTRDVVKCLRGKGVKYVEADEDGYSLGGPDNDSESIRKGMDLAPECEREIAATRK